MTVGIVTDSSCDLNDDDLGGLDVEVVPLFIRFGTDEFVDREQITVEDFYRRMAAADELPQTAAPPPGDEADIRVVDSRSVTAGLGTMVLQAARMAADGADADTIEAFVADASDRTHVFGTLDTLENLRKGGRIGGAQALLGSMLSIKPIVDISSGEVAEAAKQRTRRKALGWLRDTVRAAEPVEHLAVMHGEAADVDDFCAMLAEVHPGDIRVCKVGPVVGTHAGQGVLGMAYQVSAS